MTSEWWPLAILAALTIAVSVIAEVKQWQAMRALRSRACAGVRWRRSFPDASAASIRAFLGLFADAFGIAPRHRLRLRPSDGVMEVYRMLNPPDCSMDDAMEFETLASALERRHGLKLDAFWRDDLTIGTLFEHVSAAATDRARTSSITRDDIHPV